MSGVTSPDSCLIWMVGLADPGELLLWLTPAPTGELCCKCLGDCCLGNWARIWAGEPTIVFGEGSLAEATFTAAEAAPETVSGRTLQVKPVTHTAQLQKQQKRYLHPNLKSITVTAEMKALACTASEVHSRQVCSCCSHSGECCNSGSLNVSSC